MEWDWDCLSAGQLSKIRQPARTKIVRSILDRCKPHERFKPVLMFATSDPNMLIGGFAVGGLVLYALWLLIAWVRDAPVKPDPWDVETEKKLSEPETVEICPHCLTEQSPAAWFCKKCGSAVGPYNNLMPYVMVFSQGEVLRNGVAGRFHNRPLVLTGFVLISLSTFPLLAPIFLFFLCKNLKNKTRSEPDEQTLT